MTEQQQQQRPRIDWYQTDAYVSISVFAKGVAAATASAAVADDNRTVAVSFGFEASPESPASSLELRLSHPVAADSLQLSVKPTRLDLRLNKLQPGLRWPVLEGADDSVPAPMPPPPPTDATAAADSQAQQPQPAAKQKAKDWDAIAKSIEDEKLEGDAALNDLFQKIYSDGSDEQRKAMVKSFTESGGTVLSTNWSEIAKGKVDVKPPDGMEYKKWDS